MRDTHANEHTTRIAVVGSGHVGATTAYALVLSGAAREVVLIERGRGRAEGEAMDLQHAAALARPVRVWAGDYLSLPCVVGRGGVGRVIELPLDERERAGLHASADVLRRTLDGLAPRG